MPARKGPKKVNKYSNQLKRTAVRLSQAPGVKVKDVADALDIHPFMLSRWRKEAREGLLVGVDAASKPAPKPKVTKKAKARAPLGRGDDQVREAQEAARAAAEGA